METLLKRMYGLAKEEYERANSAHGPIASAHEGWTLAKEELEETQEELEETQEELDSVGLHLGYVWDDVKPDDLPAAKRAANVAWATAIRCACEAVQVAAVCYRFMDLKEEE